MTDQELLHEIHRNPENFRQLYNLYYTAIFGYILRRTGQFDETADLASETFLKAFNHIRQFTWRGISLKIWLYRIATNEVNQFYRNKKKNNKVFDKLPWDNKELFSEYLQHDREELEAELALHEKFLEVLQALKTLPTKYQDVISLRYFEEKEYKEIAEILRLNEGTLKSLLSRGLEKLRQKCNLM